MSSILGVTPSKQSQFDRQLRRRHKSVNFCLRSKTPPISSSTIKEDLIGRSYEKTFALSARIPLALICSCQKQDSTAEQQLARRKTELDAREKALDERERALEKREKLVAKPRVSSVPRIVPAPAEPQRTVPPKLQGLIADPSQLRTAREQRMRERLAGRQRKLDKVQRRRVRALQPNQTTAPSTEQAGSPSPSPTPE